MLESTEMLLYTKTRMKTGRLGPIGWRMLDCRQIIIGLTVRLAKRQITDITLIPIVQGTDNEVTDLGQVVSRHLSAVKITIGLTLRMAFLAGHLRLNCIKTSDY